MTTPSQDYIDFICSLYNSSYDDRIENTAPPTAGGDNRTPGDDWMPGVPANHKSLISFQRELAEQGIKLSTSKIKKILITGGLWTTETTRTVYSGTIRPVARRNKASVTEQKATFIMDMARRKA